MLRLKLCPRIVMDLTGIPMEKKRGAVGLHPEGWDGLGPSGRVEMGAVLWRSSGLHGKLRCVFGTHWDSKVAWDELVGKIWGRERCLNRLGVRNEAFRFKIGMTFPYRL